MVWSDVAVTPARILVPVEFQRVVFDSLHQLAHPGVKAGMSLIKRSYWWQGIGCDVSKWTKTCEACQKAKVHVHTKSLSLNDYLLQANDLVTFTLILSVRSIRHAKGRTFCLQSLTDGLGGRMHSQCQCTETRRMQRHAQRY